MVSLKYAAKPIGDMSEQELSIWSKTLLVKIHVITGWSIPASPEYLSVLKDQVTKHLVESYPQLNPEEIEYAFRQHGTSIEDWGKPLNLNLLDKVLSPYMSNRFYVSGTEEKLALQQKLKKQGPPPPDWRMLIELDYDLFLRDIPLTPIPLGFYDTLVEDGCFEADLYLKLLASSQKRLEASAGDVITLEMIEKLAKQRTVLKYFHRQKKEKVAHIYVMQKSEKTK